jgi:hypothetical protein
MALTNPTLKVFIILGKNSVFAKLFSLQMGVPFQSNKPYVCRVNPKIVAPIRISMEPIEKLPS